MRSVEPALLRRAPAVRSLLVGSGLVAAIGTVAVIGQSWALARLLATALAGTLDSASVLSAALPGAGLSTGTTMMILAGCVLVRVVTAWAGERMAGRAAADAAGQLRAEVLNALARGQSRYRSAAASTRHQVLLTSGLDGMQAYLSRYLPALVQAALIPLAVLLVLVLVDPLSALIVLVTLPLIPLFMALIGWFTQRETAASLRRAETLSGRFADVVAGLPDLVVLGRVKALATAVGDAAERYRTATLATLRIAFLSAMALELLATLSTALVAVTVGLRLVHGGIAVDVALLVLLLAPEAYLALRSVGTRFHAAADGVAAVTAATELLDRAPMPAGERTDVAAPPALRTSKVGLTFPDGRRLALPDVSVPAGAITVVRGASGSGKSTLLNLLARLDLADTGRTETTLPAKRGSGAGGPAGEWPGERVDEQAGQWIDLADVSGEQWWAQVGWCGQRLPGDDSGTLRELLLAGRGGSTEPTPERWQRVLDGCALTDVVAELPDGLDTRLGRGVRELSTGQRRRVALAAAVLSDRPLVLLDEPTEALDADTENHVVQALPAMVAGRTVVITSHRPALESAADQLIDLSSADPTAAGPQASGEAAETARDAVPPAASTTQPAVAQQISQPAGVR
ncbi:thiol reductant ABC exporter subunit CydD [Nakamurella aerolata]|uniref:Thiol reductant ABC exporter subunit CydD n=1 Tax=Nakamurella aerolata TaxID=1656892 RepID=A0A849A9K5_9ACTN|nr:thiol reductant ABC exporter subunit CydD [Nakamurella aerolata]NNG37225.1 thiol reductant ABC exporter subunit CydD [Nakamurella aerolata]